MKALWVTKDGVEALAPERHAAQAWNFLYWKADGSHPALLLVGNGSYGFEGNAMRDGSHRSLIACAGDHHIAAPDRLPDGAGLCDDGRITGWSSFGLGVSTPQLLQNFIAKALGMSE